MDAGSLENLLVWCGMGHFALCLGSVFIPTVLKWRTNLRSLPPLMRQMFWTYAAYILVTNFFFGYLSFFAAEELLNHSFLSTSLTLFISCYWLGRVAVQFLYFDRSDTPKGRFYTMAEIALVGLFLLFTMVYLMAFIFNLSWI